MNKRAVQVPFFMWDIMGTMTGWQHHKTNCNRWGFVHQTGGLSLGCERENGATTNDDVSCRLFSSMFCLTKSSEWATNRNTSFFLLFTIPSNQHRYPNSQQVARNRWTKPKQKQCYFLTLLPFALYTIYTLWQLHIQRIIIFTR